MTLYKYMLQIWQHNEVYMTNNQHGRDKGGDCFTRRDNWIACTLPGKWLPRKWSTPNIRFCWSKSGSCGENTELLILSSTLVSRSRHNLNTLPTGRPLIKYPQFPDILNALNIEPHNLILITVWHCRLCSWVSDCRNCMVKVVQIWPGLTAACLHTISPDHILTTLYIVQ